MKDFKIATCQMNVVDNKDTNIEHAIQLIKKASSNGAKLITLPEMFNTPYDNSKFTESDTLTPGDSVTTIKTPLANISIAICYDIRFPELWTLMNKNNTDIILLPGAFNKTTGPLHWETLIKARAIDNQCYVVATSPSQIENPYYVAWGHSMIVNPWGKIIAKAHENEEILYANITQSSLNSVRNQIPVLTNRRNDIYDTILK